MFLPLVVVLAAQVHVSGFEDLYGKDKVEHFAANVALTDAAWTAAAALDLPLWARVVVGASTGAAVSVAKEAWDYTGHGDPSLGDLTYDALGIGAGVGFALAFEAVWRRYGCSGPSLASTTSSPPVLGFTLFAGE